MSDLPRLRKRLHAAWNWVKVRPLTITVCALPTLAGLLIWHYLALDEPRHFLPRTADDWAAWGTWLGAAFTGGALIFAGKQLAHQTAALSREKQAQRNERILQMERISFSTFKSRAFTSVSPQWSPGDDIMTSLKSVSLFRIHIFVPSDLVVSEIQLRAPQAFLPSRSVDAPEIREAFLKVKMLVPPKLKGIGRSMVRFPKRFKPSHDASKRVPIEQSVNVSSGTQELHLADELAGEGIKAFAFLPADVDRKLLRVVLRDSSGLKFSIGNEGQVEVLD